MDRTTGTTYAAGATRYPIISTFQPAWQDIKKDLDLVSTWLTMLPTLPIDFLSEILPIKCLFWVSLTKYIGYITVSFLEIMIGVFVGQIHPFLHSLEDKIIGREGKRRFTVRESLNTT